MKNRFLTFTAALLIAIPTFAVSDKKTETAKQEKAEAAVKITLGPTVQHITATTAVIHWATDRVAANQVKYRSGNGKWKNAFKREGSKDHYAKLTGLTPNSNVEYQILTRDGDVRQQGNFQTTAK